MLLELFQGEQQFLTEKQELSKQDVAEKCSSTKSLGDTILINISSRELIPLEFGAEVTGSFSVYDSFVANNDCG